MTRYFTVQTAIFIAGFALGAYHLMVVSGVFAISTMPMRINHVMLALSLLFVIKPASENLANTKLNSVISLILVSALVIASLWLLSRWKPIAFSGGITNQTDFYAGIVLLLIVFEAARRGIGLILASITLVFFLYPFLAPYLPGVLEGRGSTLHRIVIVLTTDTQGIYGIPVGVAATYIIVFTIFGALLSNFGAGDFFFELSVRCTRGLRAASAKSAVLFSTLIGMVSGSAAGNVAVTGTVTIPIMKREGYAPHQAAAIEAVASTGGQIMPPVMGAAAFIMAEIVGVPYTAVMAAAILPALLFFGSAFAVVHLQATKSGIAPNAGQNASEDPLSSVLIKGGPFIGAFGTLITMMLMGYSPFKASLWAMVVLIASDIVWKRKIDKVFAERLIRSISEGARSVVTISAACAAAGIIAGVLGVTGLGSKIATLIDVASGGYLFLALFFTMITSIILGMGLPTTAAYLILATVVAPALVKLGVPALTAHFFVFYYGCISTITPPVALASYVAGGIAGANVNKVGWTAAAYAATSFVLPFAFVYGPGLLMGGTWVENIMAVGTATVGTFAIAVAIIGCLTGRLSALLRIAVAVAGLCLLFQGWLSALIGAVLFAGIIVFDRAKQATLKKRDRRMKHKEYRRVVTGHDATGTAIIESDQIATQQLERPNRPGVRLTNFWLTHETPAEYDGPTETCTGDFILHPPTHGSVFRCVEFMPEDPEVMAKLSSADGAAAFAEMGAGANIVQGGRHPWMHRTDSVDYGIVMNGEIWMVMDNEEHDVLLKAGDVVVQRGTNHAWANRGTEPCTIMFVLIDGVTQTGQVKGIPKR